jgi:16S rRNA (cytidine1402-2'-O)-methyltransferase
LGARIDVLPGPNAALGALVLSGFDIHKFRFDGFVPRKPTQRRAYLESLDSVEIAAVAYEAPSRILDLLRDVSRILPRRRIFVAREYTKMFEQQILGTAQHVMEQIARPPRGEFVVVIEGATAHAERATPTIPDTVRDAIAAMIAQGMGVRATVDGMRLATGLPRNALYKVAQRVKQQATRGRR